MTKRIVVVAPASGAERGRVRALVRWTRALVPAGVVVAASEPATPGGPGRSIRLRAEDIPSGPLSLAHALARAVKRDRELFSPP